MPEFDPVAIGTLLLAVATFSLAIEAKRARDAATAADVARQRETHILAVRPLLIEEPKVQDLPTGVPCAKVRYVTGDSPVLNLSVTIRGKGQSGDTSASTDRGSLPPRTDDTATVELASMIDPTEGRAWGPALEVVLTYHGLLGQWVVEHYEWRFNDRQPHTKTWRLYRLEVAPNQVVGARSTDQHFGEPPLYV